MIEGTATIASVKSKNPAKDTLQEKKRKGCNSKSTGFLTNLFLRTVPVSFLFRRRKTGHNPYNYSYFKHEEEKKALRDDTFLVSRTVISAMKNTNNYCFPLHYVTVPRILKNTVYLVDCRNVLIDDFYMSEKNALIAARAININAGKKIIAGIQEYSKDIFTLI